MSLILKQTLSRSHGSNGNPGFRLDVDLDLPRSGITVLFGRSGSGKSTLLRCVAGLEKAAAGIVQIGDTVWQNSSAGLFLSPEERAVGYVFQEGALFPHLNVKGNLDFANKRVPKTRVRIQQDEVVQLLELGPLLERKIGGLSGGERQRVALGRALLTSPDLLLLDEPLAALDRTSRKSILPFLETLPQRFSMPMLYVTHLPREAARLADHLVLMKDGKASESNALTTMLTDPASDLAKDSDAFTVLMARVAGHDEEFQLTRLEISGGTLLSPDLGPTGKQTVRVRILARDVSLSLQPAEGSSILNILPAEVLDLNDRDSGRVLVRLTLGQEILLALVTRKSATTLDLKPGRRVYAQVKSVALL